MASFSPILEETIHRSIAYASDRKHELATLEHLLLGLLDDKDAKLVMIACDVDLEELRTAVTSYLDEDLSSLVVKEEFEESRPTAGFHRVIQRAVIHVQSSGREEVSGGNALVALFAERESHAVSFLKKRNMTRYDAVNYISHGVSKNNTALEKEFEEEVSKNQYRDDCRLQADRSVLDRNSDILNRTIIADILAGNICDIWPEHRKNNWPLMIHVSGKWGAGKSTILNFLKSNLENDLKYFVHQDDGQNYPWVVANYNAWLEQHSQKTWWTLLNLLTRTINKNHLYFEDFCWRIWRRWQHWIVSALILSSLLIGSIFWVNYNNTRTINPPINHTITTTMNTEASLGTTSESTTISEKKVTDVLENSKNSKIDVSSIMAKWLLFLTTLGGLIAVFNIFSSNAKKTAEAIVELDSKPLAPLTKRFHSIVTRTRNPVAIFIDDLDRCDSEYVVEILQSIQTAYAHTPVLYIVAADREWIVSAYEQRYKGFKDALSKPGQPLGYMFLKKIFQMSINIPDLSIVKKKDFLESLLKNKEITLVTGVENQTVEGVANDVKEENSEPNIDIEEMKENVEKEIEENFPHRINKYHEIVEANPRAVKRLINAYTFNYLYAQQGKFEIDPDALLVWSILDLRFPFVAKRVLANPDLLDHSLDQSDSDKELLSDPEILKILNQVDKSTIQKIKQIC